jgi:O-antigen ligase
MAGPAVCSRCHGHPLVRRPLGGAPARHQASAKLLLIPFLLYHFQRTQRGSWSFIAFIASCTLLMICSWVALFAPHLTFAHTVSAGVPVKNYIDQSQEFALCAVALAYPIMTLLRAKRILPALVLGGIALSFVVNMSFVLVSRTALVTMPALLAVFALLHLKWRTNVMIFSVAIVLAALAWLASPQLQQRTASFASDYKYYTERNQPTSIGMRLEFYEKSLRFFAEAPIVGHGTGSTRGLFERAATAPIVLAGGQIVGNPHNQTLNVAVQWGIVGVVILYAMWLFHLLLFRGDGLVASIGLLVLLQNIFSSLFNSHLFDFHEGWMYVLGVGVAGGMTLKAKLGEAAKGPADLRQP